MKMAKNTNKNLILRLAMAFILVMCVLAIILVCSSTRDVAYAGENDVVINIIQSNLEAEYCVGENLMSVKMEIQFGGFTPAISHYDYDYYIKKQSDESYPTYPNLSESTFGENTFYFGDNLNVGTYNLKIIVTGVKDSQSYQGEKVVTFNVTKATLPISARTFQTEKLVYGQPISDAHDLANSYGYFTYNADVDLTQIKTPGTYTFQGYVTPFSANYQVANNVIKTIEITKRPIRVLIDNKYGYVDEPLQEFTYHVDTSTVLPGEENSYSLSFALDREVDGAGEYYIVGSMTSDLYKGLYVNTDNPDGTISVPGIYKIYSKTYEVTCIDDVITRLRILRDIGFGLDVEIVLSTTTGRFQYESDTFKSIGEYRLIHLYKGQATVPEQDYVVELTLPKYIGREVVVQYRDGDNVITQTYIPDLNGIISFRMDTTGEFALFAEDLPPTPEPPTPDKYFTEILPYDVIVWIGAALLICICLVTFRKKNNNL